MISPMQYVRQTAAACAPTNMGGWTRIFSTITLAEERLCVI